MTCRRTLLGAGLGAVGAALIAPAASAATGSTTYRQLVITRVTYDYYRREYVGTGMYGGEPVRVRYTYSYRLYRWIALVESTTHQQCEDERIESASQWTCLNGCWYPVYIVSASRAKRVVAAPQWGRDRTGMTGTGNGAGRRIRRSAPFCCANAARGRSAPPPRHRNVMCGDYLR
ncbi:hypothetical protein AAG742_03090 [Micrococcus sp. 2A]|uniref:hypothetical protein n=1 Tax=unclassified Micrococcus TaxID=2620948 RepID=UPI002006AE7E|nr:MULTISPECIES: hypothetical protein [unclassified Micrococcus]MCK6096227.1 hypothetical protein [Micrococcus sp. EYE_212]MCK6171871.1 hypothetical protein [Micrococcus sp. EYE_162]